MKKIEIKELENFLEFLQDRIESVYSNETKVAIERFLKRLKYGIKELENFLEFLQDRIESVYSDETKVAIDRYLERLKNEAN